MSKGASASHRDTAGASVLVHAAHARMPKVVKALLAADAAAGVEKDAASDEGVTALIAAAMKVKKCFCIYLFFIFSYLITFLVHSSVAYSIVVF